MSKELESIAHRILSARHRRSVCLYCDQPSAFAVTYDEGFGADVCAAHVQEHYVRRLEGRVADLREKLDNAEIEREHLREELDAVQGVTGQQSISRTAILMKKSGTGDLEAYLTDLLASSNVARKTQKITVVCKDGVSIQGTLADVICGVVCVQCKEYIVNKGRWDYTIAVIPIHEIIRVHHN